LEITRYAIYYAPPADAAWASFATQWLGWDCQTATTPDHPAIHDLPLPVADITRTPRRYGLHATLKPPFRLAGSYNRDALETACAEFCADLAPVRLDGLALTRMGQFLALCPVGATDALNALAARCVRDLDRFRAAPSGTELDQRRKSGLSPMQLDNLANWGYPHVMGAFRFHITLTGRLPRPALNEVESALDRVLSPLLPAPLVLSDLALAGEDGDGRFHLLRRFALRGAHEL